MSLLTLDDLNAIAARASEGWLKWDVPHCFDSEQQGKDWARLVSHLATQDATIEALRQDNHDLQMALSCVCEQVYEAKVMVG